MRKARLILPLALVIVIAIVAVSMADGGGDGKSQTKAGWTSYAPLADRDRAPAHDPDVMGVAEQVKDAAVKEAPDVAEPVISRSEKAGNITAKQADDLRAAAQGLADGKSPRELAPTLDLRDWDVRVVIRDALEALSRRAPPIANPIIDGAVKAARSPNRRRHAIRDKIARGRHGGCRKGEQNRAPAGDQI